MIALQSDVRVYLACGYTDMRKGMQGLAMLVQQVLRGILDSPSARCSASDRSGRRNVALQSNKGMSTGQPVVELCRPDQQLPPLQ
jgi:hypothetical protein